MQPQVADGPAVDVAHVGFQFVDDLHGPDLGAAGDGAPGKVARRISTALAPALSCPATTDTRW